MRNSEKQQRHAGGRPKSTNPLCLDIKVRLTADDAKRLESYCSRHEVKRAQAIRCAVLDMIAADDADGAKE